MARRYKEIEELKSADGRRYRTNTIYPSVPESEDDTYIITTGGDRYDTLALQFYQNKSFWWIISTANPGSNTDSLSVKPGIQLRIPANPTDVIRAYDRINKIR